jgi:hypothetical protein
MLLACLCFVDFRESGALSALWIAALGYLIALGFKETTVVLPVLLVFLDFYREKSISFLSKLKFWTAYIPFTCVLLLYVVYFFSQSGAASLAGRKTGGYYGFRGVGGVIAGIVRALINIALPLSISLGLKDIRWWHVAIVLLESAILLFLVWRFRLWAALILAVAWLVCTILPTATFAGAFNADRYLFVPSLGAAIFVGLLVHAMVISPEARNYTILACVALVLYASAGMYQLAIKREIWRRAVREVAMVIGETMRLRSRLPAGSEVDFINLTHSYRPTGMVLSNGLSEALHANGFPHSVRIVRNFSAPESEQQKLVAGLARCEGQSAPDPASNRTILIQAGGQLEKLDPGCASNIVDADRTQRALSWDQLYPVP